MIIYGTGAKDLGSKKIPGAICPSCESQNVSIVGIAKYFDVFWIPMFPYSKKVHPVCTNCDLVIDKADIDQRTANKINLEKKSFKIPFYLFSGLIIIACIILYGIYTSFEHDKEIADNLKNLQPNDVLVFENDDKTYSYGKIITISADTLFFNFSNYVFEGGSPDEDHYLTDKEKYSDFYNAETYYYFQNTLDSLYNTGDIFDLYKLSK